MWICSHKHRYIFIHIPKNAGTSLWVELLKNERFGWFKFLIIRILSQPVLNLKFNHLRRDRLIRFLKRLGFDEFLLEGFRNSHATFSEIKDIVGDDIFEKYEKIAIVRNPYSRAFSLYNYHNKFGYNETLDFSRYLRVLHSEKLLEQTHFMSIDSAIIDCKIFKFESLSELASYLKDVKGLKFFKIKHLNKSAESMEFRKALSVSDIYYINDVLIKDFINFGYLSAIEGSLSDD